MSNNFGNEGRIYWDVGLLANRSFNGTTYFHHTDWLGTERLRTDWQGQIANAMRSWAFGDGFSQNSGDTAGAAQNLNNFAGTEYDSESGTDHATYRQYAPVEGRWMSPDPYDGSYNLADPQSLNRYSYVNNKPYSFTDPKGLFGEEEVYTIHVTTRICLKLCAWAGPVGAVVGGAILLEMAGKFFGWWGKPAFTGSLTPRPQTRNADCQAGPLNLSQNMQTTKSLSGQFWSGLTSGTSGGVASAGAAAGNYVGLVQTGGQWDPKNWLGIHGSSLEPSYTAAGNINFGATCSQFGGNTWLGGQVCQYGAGVYGKLTGNYGSPLFSKYHGDWPADNQQIRQGLEIAKKGGC